MKNILIMFGGVSPEHEVSVITALQVIENIDRNLYTPIPVYITKTGEFYALRPFKNRKEYLKQGRTMVTFGRDEHGGYMMSSGIFNKKCYPTSAYLAFHGGSGECGHVQGLLDICGIPYTSPGTEASVIVMNKRLVKDVLQKSDIRTVKYASYYSDTIMANVKTCSTSIIETLGLPVILKPVHLGSSIGLRIAKSPTELELGLLETARLDTEIMAEQFLENITEYNCAVRKIGNDIETSEIERPMSQAEILSFAEKYERGGKKQGTGGMASLQRELPAKILDELKKQIQDTVSKAFHLCNCKGMVRIDCIYHEGVLYLNEINPIPGSMAFYLWESSGISFTQQITDMIEQSLQDQEKNNDKTFDYSTDIIQKFISN